MVTYKLEEFNFFFWKPLSVTNHIYKLSFAVFEKKKKKKVECVFQRVIVAHTPKLNTNLGSEWWLRNWLY